MIDQLRCPVDQGKLQLQQQESNGINSSLECTVCNTIYPIVAGIPRFVDADNYAENFGFQWNEFSATQLDSSSGIDISKKRFYSQSNWSPEALKDKLVLDVGCGAGRFTEIALAAGAKVYAIDYSSAVEACYKNHSASENIHVIQADIYHLPFAKNSFDYVYCFGVLQHTPDVRKSFMILPEYVKPGGHLCVDAYHNTWKRKFHPKRLLRPLTKRMDQKQLFAFLQRTVPTMLKLNRVFRSIPLIGKILMRFVPVADYTGQLGLNQKQVREWAVLDTFDWLAPAYDSPQTAKSLEEWMDSADLINIEVVVPGRIVGRATTRK